MKKTFPGLVELSRVLNPVYGWLGDENGGFFEIKHNGNLFKVVMSRGAGWDHVSVSLQERCPTWEEMCFFKDLFFEPEETVIQFHPAKSEYVNRHPYCLHLWRPLEEKLPIPHKEMVG